MNRSRGFTAAIAVVLLIGAIGAATMTVSASQTGMQISSVNVTPDDPVTGESVPIETTVSNPQGSNGTGDITAIYLRRAGGDLHEYGRVRNVGSVDPGSRETIRLPVTFDSPGEKRIVVNVGVEDEEGDHRTFQYPVYIDVEESDVRAELSTNTSVDGTAVELTNYGNVNLSDVEVTASVDGEEFARKYAHDVAPGSSRPVTVDTEDAFGEDVTFTARYSAADSTHTTTLTEQIRGNVPGEIDLTAIGASRSGGAVTFQGDAANVGSTDAESVMVNVPETAGVSPIAPSGEYFVGTVEASEFATFELSAAVDSNLSSVPVDVSYLVDGERVTTTREIDLESALGGTTRLAASEDGQGSSDETTGPGGGFPLTGIGIVLVLLVVASGGFAVYRRRSR